MTANNESTLVQQLDDLSQDLQPVDKELSKQISDIATMILEERAWGADLTFEHLVSGESEVRWSDALQRSRWFPLVLQFRTVLFLIPVLATWLHLATSLSAYAEMAKASPALAGEPFLVLWQTGFAGYQPTGVLAIVHFLFGIIGVNLTFSSLAVLDAILIFVAMVGSMAIGYWHDLRHDNAIVKSEALRGRVQVLLHEVTMHFAHYRHKQSVHEVEQNRKASEQLVTTLQTHVESVRGLEKYLQIEQKRLEKLEEVREQEIEVRRQLADFNRDGIGRLIDAIDRIELFTQHMDKTGETLTFAAKSMHSVQETLIETVTQSQSQLINAVKTLDANVQQNSRIGEDTIGTVNFVLDRLHGIASRVQTIADGQKFWLDLSNNLRAIAERLESFSDHYSHQVALSVTQQTEKIEKQMVALNQTLIGLSKELSPVYDALGILSNGQSRLVALAEILPQLSTVQGEQMVQQIDSVKLLIEEISKQRQLLEFGLDTISQIQVQLAKSTDGELDVLLQINNALPQIVNSIEALNLVSQTNNVSWYDPVPQSDGDAALPSSNGTSYIEKDDIPLPSEDSVNIALPAQAIG